MSKYRETPHPNDADLFLYIEDELDSRVRSDLRMHLAACWECRIRKEEFERGVRNFMEFRRDVLIPTVAPPQSNPHSLRSRLPDRPETMFRAFPVSAGSWSVPLTSGLSVALILALLTTYVLRPPQLTASEFFRNVSQASNQPVPPSKVKAQRVQIRQGAKTMEREIIHRHVRPASEAADAQWNGLLANLPVDAQDPLNPAEFAEWHARQASPRDEIIESAKTITLTSTVPALRASLVVRSSDWHPIAKQFEVPGQPPVEIREIAFELRNLPAPAITRTTLPEAPAATVAVLPEPLAEPESNLELAELEVREALRETAADRTEIPAIVRSNSRVRVEAVTESETRRDELAAALTALPGVEAHVIERSQAVPGPSAKPLRVVPPAYPTDPPLARALWDYMGGMDLANAYLDKVHSQWLQAVSATQALGRLASRYPESATLSSPVPRERLKQLAGQYTSEIAVLAGTYLRHLDQPLDAMLQRMEMTAPVAASSTSACPSWQALAPAVLEALEALQLPLRRLFLVDYAETPLSLSAGPLLSDAAQARARLRQQLGCLTQP